MDWFFYVDIYGGRKKGFVVYSGKVKDMIDVKIIEDICERYVELYVFRDFGC